MFQGPPKTSIGPPWKVEFEIVPLSASLVGQDPCPARQRIGTVVSPCLLQLGLEARKR